jgi:hypothetical protein
MKETTVDASPERQTKGKKMTNNAKGMTNAKRTLRASKSMDLTESPRRSEKGEGSILDAYNEARTRGRKSIEHGPGKYRGGSTSSGIVGGQISNSAVVENRVEVEVANQVNAKSPRRKGNPKIVVDQLQPTAIKRPSRMHRRMSAGPSYGYQNNLAPHQRNLTGLNRLPVSHDDSSSYLSQTDDDHDDESEYDSVVHSSIRSGASRYLSDPSVYGTPRRSHSDGSQSSSTLDSSGIESPITQTPGSRNFTRSSPATGSMSSLGMSPSSYHKSRTKSSPANIASSKNSPSILRSLKEESDRKLLTALNKISTASDVMTDDDECSISSIRSAKLDDLKEMFSTSKRGNMKTKKRRKGNVIRSSSQSSLSICGTPSKSINKAISSRSLDCSNQSFSSASSSAGLNYESTPPFRAPMSQKTNNDHESVNGGIGDDVSEQHDDDETTVNSCNGDDSQSECDTIEVLGESSHNASNPTLHMSATLSSLDINDNSRDRNEGKKEDVSTKLGGVSETSDVDIYDFQTSSNQQIPFYDSTASKWNTSTETLPVTNVVQVSDNNDNNNSKKQKNSNKNSLKTDQIVESLVWFSFHIPRTVSLFLFLY